jgi:hypothetical protein
MGVTVGASPSESTAFEGRKIDEVECCTSVNQDVVQLDVGNGGRDQQWKLPGPAMLLGQSEASNPIGVSIHLRCGAAFGVGVTAAISRRRVLTTRQEIMSQEPLNMTWRVLRSSLPLDSESELP